MRMTMPWRVCRRPWTRPTNGDGFWGFVDDLLTVISVVLIVLTIVALIIGAPFTGLLAGVLLGLTLLSLGLTALKYVDGRATLGDAVPVARGTDPFDVESAQAGSLRQPLRTIVNGGPRGAADAAIPHDDAQLAVGTNPAVQQFIAATASHFPSSLVSRLNAVNWLGSTSLNVYGSITAPW